MLKRLQWFFSNCLPETKVSETSYYKTLIFHIYYVEQMIHETM